MMKQSLAQGHYTSMLRESRPRCCNLQTMEDYNVILNGFKVPKFLTKTDFRRLFEMEFKLK